MHFLDLKTHFLAHKMFLLPFLKCTLINNLIWSKMKQTPSMGLTSLKVNSHNWENIGKLAIEKLKNWHKIDG